ncbi:MAG: hypothetical protein AAF502_10235 [Bacteroidota bacterium]
MLNFTLYFMRHSLFVFLLTVLSASLLAQDTYSYISDRQFRGPFEIVGYTFCPEVIGFEDGDKSRLSPGEICFNISRSYLLVKGEPIEGAFGINAIKSESYGYKLELMDANDPSKQGSMKIYLNERYQVDALVLRQSQKSEQYVFFLAKLSEALDTQEAEYFTDRNELQVHKIDSIWGQTIRPFLVMEGGRQTRLQAKDSLEVRFIMTVEGEGKKQKVFHHIETRSFNEDPETGYAETIQKFEIKKYRLLTSQDESDVEQRYYLEFTSKEAPGGVIGVYLNQMKAVGMIEIGGTRMLMRGY